MRKKGSALLLMFILSTIIFFSQQAHSADLSGRFSSVVKYYDNYFDYDKSMPVYLYGMLNVKEITDEGLVFKVYGRLADDIKDEQNKHSEIYYAYFEQKDIFDKFDVIFGRQYTFTSAGNALVDGLQIKFKPMEQLNFKLFGGGDAKLDEEYDSDDNVVGIETYGSISGFSYSLGYMRKYDEKAMTKELSGLELDYNHKDLIRVYTDLQYNMLNENFAYALTGAAFYQEKWDVTLEYLYSMPVFESTSIYSVFAVDEYREIYSRLRYKILKGLSSYISYTREIYEEYDDADVYEFGISKTRTNRFQGYVSAVVRKDDAEGDTKGLKTYASYFFHRYAVLGGGINYDVLEKSTDDSDDTTYRRYFVDVTSYLTKKLSLEAKFETVNSDLYDTYYTTSLRASLSF